jgi:hypothetical protein
MKRIGLGKGKGKGYKNIIPIRDKRVHTDSGRGIKQPQKINNWNKLPIFQWSNNPKTPRTETEINKIGNRIETTTFPENNIVKVIKRDKFGTIMEKKKFDISKNSFEEDKKIKQYMEKLKLEEEYRDLLNRDIKDFSIGIENLRIKRRMKEIEEILKDSELKKANKKYFSSKDLKSIKENTENNNHIDNLIFIAKKTGFPTVQLKEIKRRSEIEGYLVDVGARDRIYDDLMIHLGNKLSQKEYQEIYNKL